MNIVKTKQNYMNAKQKAQRLIETYTIKLPTHSQCEQIGYDYKKQGKLIAKMVATEVKKEFKNQNMSSYWDDVITEIENI